MKITRKLSGKQILAQQKSQRATRRRRSRRYVNQAQQICYSQILDNTVNDPHQFSFADYNRNYGRIDVLKTRFDDMIRTRGVDLIYYRKFNKFFEQDQQNTANMIYGEDTTAEFYLSGGIRAFLAINKQDFAFNMMGYQSQQQIDIWLTIDQFRAKFATVIGQVSSELFAVPVTGNVYTGQFYGTIDIPEFYAEIYGQLNDEYITQITSAYPQIKPRSFNSQYYNSLKRISYLEPLTGYLNGYLQHMQHDPNYLSGILRGEISYHSFKNIQNSPGWNVAPQVGDYFKFASGEIEQEYQVNQVLDKAVVKDGLNPLLGRYLYRCKCVRRTPSEEVHNNIAQDQQIDGNIDALVEQTNFLANEQTQTDTNYPEYSSKEKIKSCRKNKNNIRTNNIAKGIYDYSQDEDDITYGGYTDDSPTRQIDYVRKTK